MWIEKDTGGRCARGGALSQQVNDGIETLKRNNNFLFGGIGGNLPSEAKRRRGGERLRRVSRSTVLTASTRSGGSALLTASAASAASAASVASATSATSATSAAPASVASTGWPTWTASSRCWTTAKGAEQSSNKPKGGEELPGGGDLFGGDHWRDKTSAATNRNDDGGNERNKTWRKVSSAHLAKEPQVTSSRKRPNQPMDKCPTSGSEWKSRKVGDLGGTLYRSTQYLNNSAVYNDSIVNNETVVCQEWPEMGNPGECAEEAATEGKGLQGCQLNEAGEKQLNEAEKKKLNEAGEKQLNNAEKKQLNEAAAHPLGIPEGRKQHQRASIQSVIQRDIPALIKNTVNNHLAQNINHQVQEAIKNNFSILLGNNKTDTSEREKRNVPTTYVQDKLGDLVSTEMKKKANHFYSTVGKRIEENVKEEIERNTLIMNKQIKQNVTDQIETNLERVYNQVDLKVGKKVSNELAKNMNSVQSNLLQSVNSELNRKVKLIGGKVDSQVRVFISSELKRNLDVLNSRINGNINRELKKCLSILNRNFDENLHEQMDWRVQIFLKHVCECLGEEIKNNVNVMEKSLTTNWNELLLEKVTSRTEEAINRVREAMLIMNDTTNRAEEAVGLTKHIVEGISSEVRSCVDRIGTYVQEGIGGDLKGALHSAIHSAIQSALQSALQSLSKENEAASAKMAQVVCAKVEAATSAELARQMGALLGGMRDEVRGSIGSVETALKGSLKRSVETTLKESLETTLKGSVETALKERLETTFQRILETTLRDELSKTAQTLHADAREEEAKRSDAKLEVVLKDSNQKFDALIKVQRSLSTNLSRDMRIVKDMKTNLVEVKDFFKTYSTSLQKELLNAMEENTSAVMNTSESILSRMDISFSGIDRILSAFCEKVTERVGEATEMHAHRVVEEVATMASTHQSFVKEQRTATEERLERVAQDLLHLSEATAQRTHERVRVSSEGVLNSLIDTMQRERAHMIMHAEEIIACLKKSIEEHSSNMLANLRGVLHEKDEHMVEGLKRVSSEIDAKLAEQAKQFLSHLDWRISDAVGGRVQCGGGTYGHEHTHQVRRIPLGTKQGKPAPAARQKRYLIGGDMMANRLGSADRAEHRKRRREVKHQMGWTREMGPPNGRFGKGVSKTNPSQPQNGREATHKRKPIYVVNYLRSKNDELIEVAQHLHEKTKRVITLCGP
ncbi:hypothetical protein PVMG_04159 [Plasmodium vivax Mauritania I]|uniref:Uncharacterized protein n=1 Tax=Plasmodium vivax Mauritania I TaxID=1035515 RepID=A0A0J9TD00_PLAVI|nr:hypothetical protein PVMG_04159 [Plasmodium vivax Mauritania I]